MTPGHPLDAISDDDPFNTLASVRLPASSSSKRNGTPMPWPRPKN